MPSSPRRNPTMASLSPLPKGIVLGACLSISLAGALSSVRAQDSGPISTNASNYQKAGVNSILDLYETLSGKHLVGDAQLEGTVVRFTAQGLSK